MAYVIGFIIALMVIGAFSTRQEISKGARWLKDGIDGMKPTLTPAAEENLVMLLEQLHIEGCLYGPPIAGATADNPSLLNNSRLSLLLETLMVNSTLEQVLPRLGFSIRSTASCSDTAFVRQYPRMLVTPRNQGIGYRTA